MAVLSSSLPLPSDAMSLLPLLVEQSADLIVRFDVEGRCTYANPACFAAVSPAAPGQVFDAVLFFGEAGPTLSGALTQALKGEPVEPFELAWVSAAGEPRWHACTLLLEQAGGVLLVARDLTRHRLTEQEREREFRTLAENSPDNIIRYGPDLRAVYCNKETRGTVSTDAKRGLGRRPLHEAVSGVIGAMAYETQLAHTLATGDPGVVEIQLQPDLQGKLLTHSVAFSPERDAAGRVCGVIAVGRDITRYVEVRQALADQEREFRSLAENMVEHIVRWSPEGRFLYVNPALARLFGMPAEAIVGRTVSELFPDGRFHEIPTLVRQVASSGEPVMLEQQLDMPGGTVTHQVRIVPERDERGCIRTVLGVGRDITDSTRQRQLIEQLARTDALTRLANRQALYDQAPVMLAAAARHGRQVGLMLLDLDQFKAINDGMGHSAGDELLREIARRLQRCMRSYDLLVRLGGDEFVLVVPDLDEAADMAVLASKVHAALCAPVRIEGRDVRITASVGIAVGPGDGERLEELLANADAAMYHAKRGGRGGTQYYRRELSIAVRERLDLEEALRAAQHGDGLQLVFQPIASLHDGRVLAAEALLRWHHPTQGLVMPDTFIPIAEETGMIVPMGRWVLRQAAEAAVRWNRGRATALHIGVNVSTRQFALDDMVKVVADTLDTTGCRPEWLVIEITESLLIEDSHSVQAALQGLRRLGIRVAIDDFGTGYSALGYLARFDVDTLKIDRSFVSGIEAGQRPAELVKAFLAMAAAMGLTVVAEGIETAAQAQFLRAHGCALGQGWHFGRPMPEAAFRARLCEKESVGQV